MRTANKRVWGRVKYISWPHYLYVCAVLTGCIVFVVPWGLWLRATDQEPSSNFEHMIGLFEATIEEWNNIIQEAIEKNGK